MIEKINMEKQYIDSSLCVPRIVYQDEHLIVINKKAGEIVFPPIGDSPAICNYLKKILKDPKQFECPDRAGVVHRLDKHTSGLLLCAKTPLAETFLKKQFKKRQVKKIYHAIVKGPLYQAQGCLNFPIGFAKHPLKRRVRENGEGKEALTEYRVLKRCDDMALVRIQIHTGRTHQIRVHFSHIRHPVLGDKLYGKSDQYKDLYLCAKVLGFTHPESKKWIEFEIDYPSFFSTLAETF